MEFEDDYLDLSDDEHYTYISSDSDVDGEITYQLLATSKAKRLKKRVLPEKVQENEFEKEMEEELALTMQSLTTPLANVTKEVTDTSKKTSENTKRKIGEDDESDFYDDVYFDSDISDDDVSTQPTPNTQSKRSIKKNEENKRRLTNDELFYDPGLDDQDQRWVDDQRRSYQVRRKKKIAGSTTTTKTTTTTTNSSSSKDQQPLPRSDAVLNCPACLTTLCLDCQRHATYHNQYRAMFVFHCKIDFSERMKFPKKQDKRQNFLNKKKKSKARRANKHKTQPDYMDSSKQESNKISESQLVSNVSPIDSCKIVSINSDDKVESQEMSESENSLSSSYIIKDTNDTQIYDESTQNDKHFSTSKKSSKHVKFCNIKESIPKIDDDHTSLNSISRTELDYSSLKCTEQNINSETSLKENVPSSPSEIIENMELLQTESSLKPTEPNSKQTIDNPNKTKMEIQTNDEISSNVPQTFDEDTLNSEIEKVKTENDVILNLKNDEEFEKDSCLSNKISTSTTTMAVATATDAEYFYSVSCDICNTKVAVYDSEELYHFFNVVTSY